MSDDEETVLISNQKKIRQRTEEEQLNDTKIYLTGTLQTFIKIFVSRKPSLKSYFARKEIARWVSQMNLTGRNDRKKQILLYF